MRSRPTEEQIAYALRMADGRTRVGLASQQCTGNLWRSIRRPVLPISTQPVRLICSTLSRARRCSVTSASEIGGSDDGYKEERAEKARISLIFGGDEEDRTPDLRIANATLSQLSYVPTAGANSSSRY